MKINLNIEEDEQLRKAVHELIEGQVRHILREQLAGVVMGEIGKLKLLHPDSPSLSKLVEDEVKKATGRAYGAQSVQQLIREEIRKLLVPHAEALRAEMSAALKVLIK